MQLASNQYDTSLVSLYSEKMEIKKPASHSVTKEHLEHSVMCFSVLAIGR